jgi:hypothetical protein
MWKCDTHPTACRKRKSIATQEPHEVPAFKQLFERLESDDRDFLTPKVDTETTSEYRKGGGKKVSSEISAIFEIQQYDHAAERQNAYKYQQAIDYGVHTIALDPYGTTANNVMYMAEGLPLDFDDSTPDKGAIHGAHGRLKGDMYKASNNDMPVSIAKRFNVNLKKLLHDNSLHGEVIFDGEVIVRWADTGNEAQHRCCRSFSCRKLTAADCVSVTRLEPAQPTKEEQAAAMRAIVYMG